MTKIILVRHGQTEWNREERFRGHADVPLDETGRMQAEATAARIARDWHVDVVYAGPLSRTMKTAEAIASRFGLSVISHDGLLDMDCGKWQGLSIPEVQSQWPEVLKAWQTTPHLVQIPSGETLSDAQRRGMAAIMELVNKHVGQTVVAVSHTALNRMILLGMLELGLNQFWQIRQDVCAINVVEAGDGRYTLVTMNDTCHLKEKTVNPSSGNAVETI